MRRSAATVFALLATLGGCTDELPAPDPDALRQPTGLALAPGGRWLFVTNGNWDREESGSSLVAVDLGRLEAGIADPRDAKSQLDADRPCRWLSDGVRVECSDSEVIAERHTVVLGNGAGNLAVDHPAGPDGPIRLLTPTRLDSTLTWAEVRGFDGGELEVDCDQDEERVCGATSVVEVEEDPSRIVVDRLGFRFAYLPHLLGRRLTLLSLDGEAGPAVVDMEEEFFEEDGLHDTGLGGGFSVAQRACDLDTGNVPSNSVDCSRPFLYSTQRFWWGMRTFRVAPGLDLILPGSNQTVLGTNVEVAPAKPLMGDLRFEDPDTGERLLVVHTTPPALTRLNTELNDSGDPRNEVMQTIPLCSNPNLLEVWRPDPGRPLAFVSCYGVHELQVIALDDFSAIASIVVGEGANEMIVDSGREWLYVANTIEGTLSVVELDRLSPAYLREIAVVGLGTGDRSTAE